MLNEEFYDAADADLFVVGEGFEPAAELVGALNVPCHDSLCHRKHNSSRVILRPMARSHLVKNAGHRHAVTRGTANVFISRRNLSPDLALNPKRRVSGRRHGGALDGRAFATRAAESAAPLTLHRTRTLRGTSPNPWGPTPLRSELPQRRGGMSVCEGAYRTRRIVPRALLDLERADPLSCRTTAAGNLTGTNKPDG